jgi:hypothetical protein
MIPRTLDQFVDAATRHGVRVDQGPGGVAIECPRCQNGQWVKLDDDLGMVLGLCAYCGASSKAIAWALGDLDKAQNGHAASPSPSPSPVRPGGDSTVSVRSVPSLKGTDGPDSPSLESVPDPSSWLPFDLGERTTNPPAPPDLVGLLYLGKYHLLSGESEAMKTWLALAAAVEELRAGHGVYWVDGDDVGLDAILERLGYSWTAGETLAWGWGTRSGAKATVKAWLNSPEHRAILLSPTYRWVGIGRNCGSYLGHPDACVWTADFVTRW